MKNERLIYLALGGAGEIGMNAYVYGYGKPGKERFILVDIGVTFPDMDTTPGVDLIFPDMTWLEDNADRLEAIFITHAHEDHIGAVGHTFNKFQTPIYTRKFTGAIARRKLSEHGIGADAVTIMGAWPETVSVGPFEVGFMPVSHSIPEASGMVIDTPKGRIVHTGDFKLDETPGLGEPFDETAWSAIAAGGVKALVCDSTNIFSPEAGRSESSVGPAIEELVASCSGMVVATTFASNIARVRTLANAGVAAGRSIVLLGRAMDRMVSAGIEAGVVTDFPPTISADDARELPRENLMLLVTGSQGERRAASAQLSRGKYRGLKVRDGDTFLFSSKTIPGNENGVARIINAYSEMGVDVIDDYAGRYHVSGHANGPDLARVHQIMQPEMIIPMHGEHRHLRTHMKMANANGFASIIAPNGAMVDLSGSEPEIVEYVDASRIYIDGNKHIGATDGIVRDRIRMALNGIVVVGVIIDEDDDVTGDAWAEVKGLAETGKSNGPLVEEIEDAVNDLLSRAKRRVISDDDAIEEAVRRAVRQVSNEQIGKKPEVIVLISRMVAQ